MKKIIHLSHSSRNMFTIPLIVASLLILGVLGYAALTGTDFRSRAWFFPKRCYNAVAKMDQKTRQVSYSCPIGWVLSGKQCCFKQVPKPTPGCYYEQVQCVKAPCNPILVCPTTPTPRVSCVPGPACLYAERPCNVMVVAGSPPFCPEPPSGCISGSTCTISICPTESCGSNGCVLPPCFGQQGICQNNRCIPYTTPKPTPRSNCIPKPPCVDGIVDPTSGEILYCDPKPGTIFCIP